MLLLAWASWARDHLGWPFHFAFKLWPCLADVGNGILVFALARRRLGPDQAAFLSACYLFSPLAIAISAFHGNTDCILVFWLLLSLHEWPGHADRSALALGAALCTKYTGALLLPAMLSLVPTWRGRLRYLALSPLLLLGLSAPILLLYPARAAENILAYSSYPGTWGLGHLVGLASSGELGELARRWLTPALTVLLDHAKGLIVVGVLALCAANSRRQRLDGAAAYSACFAIFLALAPGFGVQYAVWPLAFFLVAEPRWGQVYHLAAAVFVIQSYDRGRYDLRGLLDPHPRVSVASLLAWVATVVIACRVVRRLWRPMRE